MLLRSIPPELIKKTSEGTTAGLLESGLFWKYIQGLHERRVGSQIIRAELAVMIGAAACNCKETNVALSVFKITEEGEGVRGSDLAIGCYSSFTKSYHIEPPITEDDFLTVKALDDQNVRDGVWFIARNYDNDPDIRIPGSVEFFGMYHSPRGTH